MLSSAGRAGMTNMLTHPTKNQVAENSSAQNQVAERCNLAASCAKTAVITKVVAPPANGSRLLGPCLDAFANVSARKRGMIPYFAQCNRKVFTSFRTGRQISSWRPSWNLSKCAGTPNNGYDWSMARLGNTVHNVYRTMCECSKDSWSAGGCGCPYNPLHGASGCAIISH
jgi:hypothetical protein